MPVTVVSPTESYTIAMTQTIFTPSPAMTVTFNHIIDGSIVANPSFQLTGAAFLALFTNPSDGVTALATWIENAIYAAAITAGVISGTTTADVLP